MSYTSGAPDREPWVNENNERRASHPQNSYGGGRILPLYAHDPRTFGSANPYLQAFRDYLGSWPMPSPVLAREWLQLPTLRNIPRGSHMEPEVTQATRTHARHATLVLLRIAELDRADERERAARHE